VSVARGMTAGDGALGMESLPQAATVGPQASVQVVAFPLSPARGSVTTTRPTLNPGNGGAQKLGEVLPEYTRISNMEDSIMQLAGMMKAFLTQSLVASSAGPGHHAPPALYGATHPLNVEVPLRQ
jgi:hypothetical protein